MIKVLEIDRCLDCKHLGFGFDNFCSHPKTANWEYEKATFWDVYTIPDWCPLSDIEEYKNGCKKITNEKKIDP